jgi:uncharacterized membrane protein
MTWFKPTSLLDKFFEGGVLLKGITGLFEFGAGLLLFFVSPQQINSIVVAISQKELTADPNDKVALFLFHSTAHLSAGGRMFAIVYLWIHAMVKLIAVVGLLRNQKWAYPFSLITLGLLMLYQVYLIVWVRPSVGLILLTVVDMGILWLIWREYKKVYPKERLISSA